MPTSIVTGSPFPLHNNGSALATAVDAMPRILDLSRPGNLNVASR
jgi:hypothetical protein